MSLFGGRRAAHGMCITSCTRGGYRCRHISLQSERSEAKGTSCEERLLYLSSFDVSERASFSHLCKHPRTQLPTPTLDVLAFAPLDEDLVAHFSKILLKEANTRRGGKGCRCRRTLERSDPSLRRGSRAGLVHGRFPTDAERSPSSSPRACPGAGRRHSEVGSLDSGFAPHDF